MCAAHPHRDDPSRGPLVTIVNRVWALCEGNGPLPHDWTAIAPTRAQFAADAVPMDTKRRWWRRWWDHVRS